MLNAEWRRMREPFRKAVFIIWHLAFGILNYSYRRRSVSPGVTATRPKTSRTGEPFR